MALERHNVDGGVSRPGEAGVVDADLAGFQALFEALPVPSWIEDGEGRFVALNGAALRRMERPLEELVGRPVDTLRAAQPEAEGPAGKRQRERLRSGNGGAWEVFCDRQPARLGGEPAVLVIGGDAFPGESVGDEVEGRVRERTAQLEAMNKELEAFAYSVSHDLRAPLRSIRGFSEALLERNLAQLDERGRDCLRRVVDSSKHMERLIEDLLKLSRVSRGELRVTSVDLSRVAEGILGNLKRTEPVRSVETVVEPGLQAQGDERLLGVMLENLLRNAWKFTSRSPRARIEFRRDEAGGGAFVVRDNGVGFDMRYADKLFGVFQRLHTPAEFPGTGIGLATVQRIVNRHSGRVWAQAAAGQGASFYFTLPAGRAAEESVSEP